MKKILLIIVLFSTITLGINAQVSSVTLKTAAQKAKTAASVAGVDVNNLQSSIMSKLTSKLALSQDQKTKVSNYVTTYLTDKSKIASLFKTDKTKYASKLSTLQTELTSKLKTVLSNSQYKKYLNLKPTANTATNVLSQLFY